MIKPQIAPNVWSEMYQVKISTLPCKKCGIPQTADIPVAFKEWRGFEAPLHDCGEEYQLLTVVSTDADFNSKFQILKEEVYETLNENN
jgi:hypothetical protein